MFQLNRRTLLRGLGTSLSLPFLEAMTPYGRARAAAAPTRMAFVFFPNGAIMPSWMPRAASDFQLGDTLRPLQPFKDDLLLISGLAQDNGRAKGDGPGDHARSAASFLTGAHPAKTSGADIRNGISVDQVAAEKIGSETRLPSLELGIEPGRNAGSCDSGYSCAYSNTISWKTASTPMAKEVHPRLVFERLFQSTNKADARRELYRKSILDLVANDADQLKATLGQTDRRKLDEYLTAVRELELRLARAEQDAARTRPDIDVPHNTPRDMQEHIRLMYDLLVLAFQTDSTRIATLMLGNEGSNRSYPFVGVNGGWHQLSHHQNDPGKVEQIRKIDLFHATQFARFIERLKSVREGDESLLDHSMILYGSGLSDGNRHDHNDLPVVLVGRAGGTIRSGRHLKLPRETPMNNLFLSMLARMGVSESRLGDSTGPMPGLDG